ncbi:glycosyltransferase family 61 protein [Geomonas sp.]|uniref:glycosyltransferase family 61 protein n=1 Tax=Geomonas sp. TaxID=2651584 RepID=UPI002B4A5884|nr:glycosyltransferase family 61 protein [Geomonas sp.]HJV33784.1 glycosyltransferase family 61 protein [Geomonas sp.]
MIDELNEHEAKERKRRVSQLSLELLGPVVGKMPKSSIESLEKASYLPNVERHLVEIIPLTDARIVKHEVEAKLPPFIRTEAVFGKRNLYLLRDAVVSPYSGMAWIGNRIMEESVGSLRRIMDWGDILHEPLLPVQELTLQEPVVVCHPATYFHWLFEVLPNILFALARFPEIKIVLPEKCPDYVREGLAVAVGAEPGDRFITCSGPVRVKTLVMPQYHNKPEFTNPEVLGVLRSELKGKLLQESSPARNPGPEKLYISRRRSRRRRLGGEELLEERLRERGFSVVHCEELSFREQIRLFDGAKTVVSTHGAGLSNLVWSEAPCRVIEIFPKNYILDCFAWLSFSLGFDYRYVICRTGHQIDEGAMDAVLDML